MMNSNKLAKKIIAVLVAIVMVFQYGLGVSDVSAATNHTMSDNAITGFSIKAFINNDWKSVDEVSGAIERGTRIQVSIKYDPETVLKENGAERFQVNDKILYKLPKGLKVTQAQSGVVTDGPIDVGKYEITTDGRIIIEITNRDYLEDKNGRLRNGTISFYGGFDGDYWNEGGVKEVRIGQFAFNIELTEKEKETSGTLNVVKQVVKDGVVLEGLDQDKDGVGISYDSNNNAYIEYLITVTAPKENTKTMKDVKVADTFSMGSKYLSWAEVVNASKGSASVNTGVWSIGEMAPGSKATLRIKAYLKADFFYVQNTANVTDRVIANTAVVKSENKEYDRHTVYTASNWGLNINKENDGYKYNEETKKGTVKYTVTVSAPKTNKVTINNVTVYDAFGGENNVKKYVVGYTINSNGVNCQPNTNNKTLSWNIGDMAPGDTKKLVYTVEINSDIFNDSIDANNDGVNDGVVERTLPNTATLRVNGKDVGKDSSDVKFKKEWIYKNGQIDHTTGKIKFVIQVNKSEEGIPDLNGTLTVTDKLSGEWVYDGNITVKKYWVEDGAIQEDVSSFAPNTSTSWSKDVPGGYYYEFEYYARPVGAQIGEASISNKAGVGIGVGGKNYYHETSWQGTGKYYDCLKKEFVKAKGDVVTWKSYITSNIPAGAHYLDYRNESYGYKWSFTDAQIAGVVVEKGGQKLVKDIDYSIKRTENSNDRFEITFLKAVEGVTQNSPITITYDTTLVTTGLNAGASRDFVNNARLKVGESRAYASASYKYYKDQKLTKAPKKFNAETGELEWTIKVNQTGSMSGDAVLTEYLPEGLKFKSASITKQGGKASIESITTNDKKDIADIKLKGLEASGDTSRYVEIKVVTELADKNLLLTNFNKEFVNSVELNYDGNITTSTAKMQVENTALTKKGSYNESTAPYIEYTIHINPEGHDLLKDGTLIKVVDEMSDKMMLKVDSLTIVDNKGAKYEIKTRYLIQRYAA